MRIIGLVLLVALGLDVAGCARSGSPPRPLILTLTQNWQTWSPRLVSNVVGELNAGTLTFQDARLRTNPCDFTADYSSSPPPLFRAHGTPGTPGFNVLYSSLGLHTLPGVAACAPGVPVPRELVITTPQGIAIGQWVRGPLGIEATVGTDMFTAEFAEFRLTALNTTTGYATGEFRFLATNRADRRDTRVLVVTDGAFAARF